MSNIINREQLEAELTDLHLQGLCIPLHMTAAETVALLMLLGDGQRNERYPSGMRAFFHRAEKELVGLLPPGARESRRMVACWPTDWGTNNKL